MIAVSSTKQIDTCQKTAGGYFTPASPRAWAAYRAARRARGGVTPPIPRWSARGNSGRRSCRWQQRRNQESLRPAACRTEMKGQRVATFGCPHPLGSLTGKGDLLPSEARLIADHGPGATLALQAMAHRDARRFALDRKVKLPAAAGGVSGGHGSAPWLSIGNCRPDFKTIHDERRKHARHGRLFGAPLISVRN